jgi:hypothetical protein
MYTGVSQLYYAETVELMSFSEIQKMESLILTRKSHLEYKITD